MDIAQTLIRTVVRAFYDTKHILVVDALIRHSALPAEDLAHLLSMQQKDLRKLCGRLREDRLLTVHARQEVREGQQRPINRDYYYIDLHLTIDAIKYRIHQLEQTVRKMYKPSEERKEYSCPRCKAQWSQMEVLDNIAPGGYFLCHTCDGVLQHNNLAADDQGGHEKQSKLMSQIQPLLGMMQKVDSSDIPQNDFDTALSHQVPIIRDESINPAKRMEVYDRKKEFKSSRPLPAAKAPEFVVSFNSEEQREAAAEAEKKRKADAAAQNILPEWHTRSTVTGEMTALGNKEKERMTNGSLNDAIKREDSDEKKAVKTIDAELEAYYAQMAQEKAKEAEGQSSEDEEEDADEYEEVDIGPSTANTPSSSTSGPLAAIDNLKPLPTVTSSSASLKRRRDSVSESSGTNTGVSTPAAGDIEDSRESPAKKVKLENGDVPKVKIEAPQQADDDDDEAEFEDAL